MYSSLAQQCKQGPILRGTHGHHNRHCFTAHLLCLEEVDDGGGVKAAARATDDAASLVLQEVTAGAGLQGDDVLIVGRLEAVPAAAHAIHLVHAWCRLHKCGRGRSSSSGSAIPACSNVTRVGMVTEAAFSHDTVRQAVFKADICVILLLCQHWEMLV